MDPVAELRNLLDPAAVLDATETASRPAGIWRDDTLQAAALVRPRSTAEVAAVLRWCHQHNVTVVSQGGLTGLVHGADAGPGQIILSLERMRTLEEISPQQRTATVQAGVVLQTLQEAAETHELMFPLDLGARGTATLGGAAAGKPPIPQNHPFYVLVESQGADPELDPARFERCLASAWEAGLLADAVIAKSEADCRDFWALRDDVGQVLNGVAPIIFDISLPIAEMEQYTQELAASLDAQLDQHRLWIFGHLGDGNLHLSVQVPHADYERLRPVVEQAVYQPLAPFRGSVSAEHGIGLEKKPYLGISRSETELTLMHTLKKALDPRGILNPGKILA